MSKRRKLILAFVGAVAIAGVLLTLHPEPEPRYRDISLSEWLVLHRSYKFRSLSHVVLGDVFREVPGRDTLGPEAEKAIKQIGTNALPFLTAWMSGHRQAWKMNLHVWARKLPKVLRPRRLPPWLNHMADRERASLAAEGIRILGHEAAVALPDLVRIACDQSALGKDMAVHAMVQIGKPAVPVLASLLSTNGVYRIREDAMLGLGWLGPKAADGVPAIAVWLDKPDERMACLAARALGQIRRRSEVAIPALMASLDDPRYLVRLSAVKALGEYGSEALPAVPRLRELLVQPDLELGRQAEQALTMIVASPSSEPFREGFNLLLPLPSMP